MKPTTALAWGLVGLSVALTAAHLWLTTMAPESIDPLGIRGHLELDLLASAGLAVVIGMWQFTVVGAVIATRHPQNPIGWLFCAIALSEQTRAFASTFARAGYLASADAWPGALEAAIVGRVVAYLPFCLALVAVLLFPTGRLPSVRWRPLLFLVGAHTIALVVLRAAGPWPAVYGVTNPLGVDVPTGTMLDSLFAALFPGAWSALALTSALSVFFRWRSADATQRQQLKWFVYLAAIALMYVAAFWLVGGWVWIANQEAWLYVLVVSGYSAATAAIPVAAAIAILRYRLYDIDVLINRTLVYGATVATLGALYVGAIVGLQSVLSPFTQGNELAVALSTLGAVALFTPVRARVQRGVDRRFYRSRYDATRTLDSLALRLRDQVDLDAIRGDLLVAVRDTMQPAHVGLWLRDRTR